MIGSKGFHVIQVCLALPVNRSGHALAAVVRQGVICTQKLGQELQVPRLCIGSNGIGGQLEARQEIIVDLVEQGTIVILVEVDLVKRHGNRVPPAAEIAGQCSVRIIDLIVRRSLKGLEYGVSFIDDISGSIAELHTTGIPELGGRRELYIGPEKKCFGIAVYDQSLIVEGSHTGIKVHALVGAADA